MFHPSSFILDVNISFSLKESHHQVLEEEIYYMKKPAIVIGFLLLAAILVLAGIEWWTGGALSGRRERNEYAYAQKLIAENKIWKAQGIINRYTSEYSEDPKGHPDWLSLAIITLSKTPEDSKKLLSLYTTYPKAFNNQDEKVILALASQLILQRNYEDYQNLKKEWASKTKDPAMWLSLDSDVLVTQDKRQEAIDLLKSKTFNGPQDLPRLVRLGILTGKENLGNTWNYLNEAAEKDPKNPDVRVYRAQILEQINKLPLARLEYISAIQADPKNPKTYDQLAEFFRRHGQFQAALAVWNLALPLEGSDEIWVKTLFWNKVSVPYKIEWDKLTPPDGKYTALIEYLLSLKPNQFWDAESYQKVPNGQAFVASQQETFWLRLIDALQHDRSGEAADILYYNPFKNVTWSPVIQDLLEKVITFRKTGAFKKENQVTFQTDTPESKQSKETFDHPFIRQLDQLSSHTPMELSKDIMPNDLRNLLMSPEAYSATFLVGGWLNAALSLNKLAVIPNDFPLWYSYGLTQAIRFLKGPQQALEFATKQPSSPPLDLLLGELLVTTGNPDAALDKFQQLESYQNEVGYRAVWMSSLIDIDKGRYKEAQEKIDSRPPLANSLVGKETLALIALREGKEADAEKLYLEIVEKSPTAKYYLASKAIKQKNWKQAKAWMQELLREYPDNQDFINLYKQIEEGEKNG